MNFIIEEAVKIEIGDLIERRTTIEGSEMPPSIQRVVYDEEMKKSMEMADSPEYKHIFSKLKMEITKVWKDNGTDYVLVWEKGENENEEN